MFSQEIKLNKTKNTRTLSNLVNKEGRRIKDNRLIRSDALDQIDEEDKKKLTSEYHLKRIIDLRTEMEAHMKPDQQIQDVKHYLNPILENEQMGLTKKGDMAVDFKDFVKKAHEDGLDSSEQFMEEIYGKIIDSSFSNEAYSKFLNLLLEEVQGATLWHCSAGKDRAGFATILVLYLLDFDMDTILEDYLATNHFYEPHVKALVKVFGPDYEPSLWSVFGVKKSYFTVLMTTIQKRFRSFDAYIEDILHFSKDKKEQLKKIYLEV